MIATLDDLATAGLIRRHVDLSDRRRRVLALTPRGARRFKQGLAAADRADEEILGVLTSSQHAGLRAAERDVYEQLRRTE